MQITIQLTVEQEAALNYAAAKASTPGKAAVPATDKSPEIPAVPANMIAPEDYFRGRVADLLGSYAGQRNSDDERALTQAFKFAPELDRVAAFAALKTGQPSKGTDANA